MRETKMHNYFYTESQSYIQFTRTT